MLRDIAGNPRLRTLCLIKIELWDSQCFLLSEYNLSNSIRAQLLTFCPLVCWLGWQSHHYNSFSASSSFHFRSSWILEEIDTENVERLTRCAPSDCTNTEKICFWSQWPHDVWPHERCWMSSGRRTQKPPRSGLDVSTGAIFLTSHLRFLHLFRQPWRVLHLDVNYPYNVTKQSMMDETADRWVISAFWAQDWVQQVKICLCPEK